MKENVEAKMSNLIYPRSQSLKTTEPGTLFDSKALDALSSVFDFLPVVCTMPW